MESDKVSPTSTRSRGQGVDIGGRDSQTFSAHWPISVSNRGAQSSVDTLSQNIRSRKFVE